MTSDAKTLKALKRAHVPKEHWEHSLDDYDTKRGDIAAYDAADECLARLLGNDSWKGMLLIGPPGVAKTMLASIVLREGLAAGKSGYFIPFTNYVDLHHEIRNLSTVAASGDGETLSEWRTLRELVQSIRWEFDLVVLDDVGKEHRTSSGYAEDLFDALVRDRYNRGLMTIMTSNIPLTEWAGTYNESMSSFVHQAFDVVAVAGKDARRGRR